MTGTIAKARGLYTAEGSMRGAIAKARAVHMAQEEAGGQGTTEYAILIGFIVIIAAVSVWAFSDNLAAMWDAANNRMEHILDWNHQYNAIDGHAGRTDPLTP